MAEAIPGHIHCLRCRRQWIGIASERCPFCTRAAVAKLQTNLVKMSRDPAPVLGQGYAVAMESAAVWLHNALTGELLKDLPPWCCRCDAPGSAACVAPREVGGHQDQLIHPRTP